MDISPLALVVLALYAERSRHPYDVLATMRSRGEEENVKVSAGTVYHTIARLADAGLLTSLGTEREGNRPERTEYAITDAGHRALADELRTKLRQPTKEYPHFRVAVSQLHNLDRDEAAALLRERVASLDVERQRVSDHIADLVKVELPYRIWLDWDLTLRQLDLERDWCARTADQLAAGEIDWTSPVPPDDEQEAILDRT